ncbi:hypothetical protein J1605_021203 [Eschrichtius robustus]|uniref:Uncharacterized protein n=1 Tax=Eschrichtius robustus TaxID=9764 RepID=A0AB34HIP3_ESCRO|nr:hypothetical protein J1605_021203 [Eschrichtius robustus]
MGIRGLMSFVEDHSNEFFTDLKLRDTKIIIDGYALFHRLCFSSNLELRSMGEYLQSQGRLQDFFQHGAYACPDTWNPGLPPWVLAALARGQLSPFISDALVLRRTILHTQHGL